MAAANPALALPFPAPSALYFNFSRISSGRYFMGTQP